MKVTRISFLEHYGLFKARDRNVSARSITLVLMMINSCSYSTNYLVFIKFQILTKILVGI